MTKPKLKVIEGGLKAPKEQGEKVFISAYVTDTRLMGVVGMYIHWRFLREYPSPDFHQFFYFDAEEYGFETYKSVLGNDVEEISQIEQALIGGLGGQKVEITKKQSAALLQRYVQFNKDHDLPMPENRGEYEFMLTKPVNLDVIEKQKLLETECVKIESDYQLINYFLMRCLGNDYVAAEYLRVGDFPLDLYEDYPSVTLCKNVIDERDEGDYLCESLIEYNDRYISLISEITVSELKVTGFKRCSSFNVSPAEANMMLARPEFITLYEILMPSEDFNSNISSIIPNTMVTNHENGKLFLAFNNNNDHVKQKVFRLSEDVFGLYYVSDFGQLLAASYDITGIHALERELRKSALAPYLMISAKYEFKEPVLYEFMQSEFDDFNEFLDFIKS